ncbi:MAG: DUF4115 domain-containing protein [Maritimibacter sp.]
MIRRWVKPKVTEQADTPAGFDTFDLRLGDLMRGERATLGKSLLDVQRELKIKASYIAAIENADVKAFETPSFVAGYVRSYARYLGMDPDEAFAGFCRESGYTPVHGMAAGSKSVEKTPEYTGDPLANPNASFVPRQASVFEGIEPGAVGSVAVLVALVGVLGFGGWSLLRQIQKVDFAPVEQNIGVVDQLQGLEGTGTTDLAGADSGLVTPPSSDALDRLYRPEALDVPVLIARDGPISTLDPSEVGVLTGNRGSQSPGLPVADAGTTAAIDAAVNDAVISAASAETSGEGIRVFGPDAPKVAIFATSPAWVRVRSADGSVIFEKILDAGETYVLPATETPPILRAGNAGAVYFAVNGTAYGPAGSGGAVVKNIALDAASLRAEYTVADLSDHQDLALFADASQ